MANIWREPIFDRTQRDVAFALQQLSAWKTSHSHVADVKVENDSLVVKEDVETYVNNDALVVQNNGVTYVENETLVLQLGTIYDLKGCLNLSDITRIEDDISYLATILTQYRYAPYVNTREWEKNSLPTVSDMKRIGDNIRSLFTYFVTPNDAIPPSNVMLSYEDINILEYNLHLLKVLLDEMIGSFVKSGTLKSGTTNRLPIRR